MLGSQNGEKKNDYMKSKNYYWRKKRKLLGIKKSLKSFLMKLLVRRMKL